MSNNDKSTIPTPVVPERVMAVINEVADFHSQVTPSGLDKVLDQLECDLQGAEATVGRLRFQIMIVTSIVSWKLTDSFRNGDK